MLCAIVRLPAHHLRGSWFSTRMRALRVRVSALTVLCLVIAWAPAARAAADPAAAALRSLQRALAGDLKRAGGNSSALVVDLSTGQTLYSAAPDAPRLPASLEKLYHDEHGADRGSGRLPRCRPRCSAPAHSGWAASGRGRCTCAAAVTRRSAARASTRPPMERARPSRTSPRPSTPPGSTASTGRSSATGRCSTPSAARPATGYAPNIEVEGQLGGLTYDAGFTTPPRTRSSRGRRCSRRRRSSPHCAPPACGCRRTRSSTAAARHRAPG